MQIRNSDFKKIKIKSIIAMALVLLAFTSTSLSFFSDKENDWDELVACVIQVESNGNPNAVSKAGAIGLMQITPVVLKEFNRWGHEGNLSIEQLYDSYWNIRIGTWYLRRLKDHYLKDDYTKERMLASYHGGPTRMRALLRQGKDWEAMPKETVRYVKKM